MPSPASGADRALRGRLAAALVAVGAGALLAQVALLRELLVTFHGNELTLGCAFAAWLTLTAAGSAAGGRAARSPSAARWALGGLLATAPLLLALSLWLTRLARPEALLVGEEPSLLGSLPGALLALAPACLLGGAAFALAVAALPAAATTTPARATTPPARATGDPAGAAGDPAGATTVTRAWLAETLGAAAAGAAFHFVLGERLDAPWILGLAAALLAAAGVTLLVGRAAAGVAAAALVVGVTAAVAPPAAAALQRARFPGQEVVRSQPSRYGQLTVTRRGEQLAFFHDGVVLFTTEDQLAAEERVHLPLLLHPRPRRVLLVGGAFGGGLHEALKHDLESVEHVELDPAVIALARHHAGAADRAALGDRRVRTHLGDGRDLLRRRAGAYDVIVFALPDPRSALLSRFWSHECLADARRALQPGGLLAVSVAATESTLDGVVARKHAVLWRTLWGAFPTVGVAPGGRALLWAAERPVPADPALLARRLEERHLALERVGPGWLLDRLTPFNVDEYVAAVARVPARADRDFRPVAYRYGLLEGLQRSAPAAARVALRVADSPRAPWLLPLLIVAPALAVALVRRGRGAPGLAALAAGAGGMALQLVVLLAFQAVRGHLYVAVGGLAAAFMLGMAAGAAAGLRMATRARGLALACAAAAAVGAATPLALTAAATWPAAAAALLFAQAALAGAATGAVFAPAVSLLARGSTMAAAAARAYAFDLAGAAAAALVASLVAVPLLGLPATAWAAAALCGAAALASARPR